MTALGNRGTLSQIIYFDGVWSCNKYLTLLEVLDAGDIIMVKGKRHKVVRVHISYFSLVLKYNDTKATTYSGQYFDRRSH